MSLNLTLKQLAALKSLLRMRESKFWVILGSTFVLFLVQSSMYSLRLVIAEITVLKSGSLSSKTT